MRQKQGRDPFCMAYRWMFFCVVVYDGGSVCNNLVLFCSFLGIISLTDAVFIIVMVMHSQVCWYDGGSVKYCVHMNL
jgi:hypothetical protein